MLSWVRFEVVIVLTMKDNVLWDVMLYSLVKFVLVYPTAPSTLKMAKVGYYKMMANFYQPTWCHIPKYSILHIR